MPWGCARGLTETSYETSYGTSARTVGVSPVETLAALSALTMAASVASMAAVPSRTGEEGDKEQHGTPPLLHTWGGGGVCGDGS